MFNDLFHRFFIYFLLLHTFFIQGVENLPLSDTDGGNASVVFNAVNVICGTFVDVETDFTLLGPESLTFQRLYSSADYATNELYKGWRHNQDSFIEKKKKGKEGDWYYKEKSGRNLPFEVTETKHRIKSLDFSKKSVEGYTNLSCGIIGGCTHAKNTHIKYSKKDKIARVKNGFGEESEFGKGYAKTFLYLNRETKLSGNYFQYLYDKKGNVEQVQGFNRQNQMYSWLRIVNPAKEIFKKNPHFEIHTSDGRKIYYHLGQINSLNEYSIGAVISDEKPHIHYEYKHLYDDPDNRRITKKSMPNGRSLAIDYYRKEKGVSKDSFKIDRVKRLRAPSGHDASPIEIYRFDYISEFKRPKDSSDQKKKGYTSVTDANNHLMHYGFIEGERLDRVQKFRGDNPSNYSLYSLEKYLWDGEGSLTCRYLQDEHSNILVARTFDYDAKGNVIKDSFYGNLKGNSPLVSFNHKRGKPENNGCDVLAIEYSYSNDDFNLLTEERHQHGKKIKYFYDETTKALTAKFILENEKILIREFYEYDQNVLVTCSIVDDGTGYSKEDLTNVTTRKFVRTFNSEVTPVGLPFRVDESYFDFETGQERLLKRKFNNHDIKGRLLASYHYDCHGRYIYSQLFEYDAHGNVTLETNGAGQTIERDYNENNNLIFERGFSKSSYKKFHYDFMGRLILLEEFHSDGTVLCVSSRYDRMGNLFATIDPFGYETLYFYDEFNRLIKKEEPKFISEELLSPVTTQEYDIFGNVIFEKDALNRLTRKEYNIRGDLLKITYHDGQAEFFSYREDGALTKSVEKKGSYWLYEYDCLKRLLKKEYFTKSGEFLYSLKSSYNSFHKLTDTDANGLVTNYRYDARGLLICISKEGELKEFEYDDCLRVSKTKEWTSEDDYKLTLYSYDVLNQIIEEQIQDSKGETIKWKSYSYDNKGNQTEVVEKDQETCFISKKIYDSHDRIIKTIDAAGYETRISYDYQAYNDQGQRILKKEEYGSDGVLTITEYAPNDKPAKVVKKNVCGQLLAEKIFFYDATGNVTLTKEKAVAKGDVLKEIKTRWCYNWVGLIERLIEAEESPDQKTTEYRYNNFQEKILQIKPDGTSIHYGYDELGRINSVSASDNSFNYEYFYDKFGNLIESKDLNQNESTFKSYDLRGRLLKETLGTMLSIEYSYDLIGRPTLVKLPDGTSSLYSYDAFHLKRIDRFDAQNKLLYTHEYLKYNFNGDVCEVSHILKGGESKFSYDNKGHLTEIETESFSEKSFFDEKGNLIKIERKEPLKNQESLFSYDDLHQLSFEKGVKEETYLHDSLNNCLLKNEEPQEVNSLNQLVKSAEISYSYDKNGNRTKGDKAKQEYLYDALDRLIKVISEEAVYTYTYDSFNRRLKKIKRAHSGELLSEIHYLYMGENEVGSYEKGKIKEFRLLGVGKGAEIGAAVSLEINDAIYIPFHDQNGNMAQIKEATTGTVVESYHYTAFGECQLFDGKSHLLKESEIQNPWYFASKRMDEETEFTNFGRRYYDAKTHRWLSPDPLGFEGGSNLYAYVFNNPLTMRDLYGLETYGIDFGYDLGGNSKPSLSLRLGMLNYMLGRGVQLLGAHIIPLPAVRGVVMALGGFIAGDGFILDPASWRKRQSKPLEPYGTIQVENHETLTINGILNQEEGATETQQKTSHKLGGEIVYHIFNASRGLMTDLSECVLLILGFETESVKIAARAIKESLARVGPNGTIDIFAHSMGGLIIHRALEKLEEGQLEQITVYTFGSAKMIRNSRVKSFNMVSLNDPIPFFADPVGCLIGLFSSNSNVHFLSPKGYPGFDHCLFGGTYEHELDRITAQLHLLHGL